MALLKIRRTKLEDYCQSMPQFGNFLKSFFQPIREYTEWNQCYFLYMDSIAEGIRSPEYANKFNLKPEDFKTHHQDLLDAFISIVKVDPTRK
ncbi:MAG: hypothetical protein AABY09_02215, partial [Nanoarchaeota archaeon]